MDGVTSATHTLTTTPMGPTKMADAELSTKRCSKCKQFLPLTSFSRDKQKRDGISCSCSQCRWATQKNSPNYRSAGRLEFEARYREANKELINGRRRNLPEEDRVVLRALANKRRADKPEQYREAEKKRYYRDVEGTRRKNRDKSARRYKNNRQKIREYGKKRYRENPEIWKAGRDRYRARKTGATGSYTSNDISAIRIAQSGKCAYCRKSLKKAHHIDHIIPLSKGGSNEPRNLQLTCASCNLKKRDKDPMVFARTLGRLL